ncbi:hypothetical protein K505DRAFT_410297 [Melanomma pulvis-pyrius CBS 109.77]|uniref:Uncharacterized protein n=1 Tax=Melanomma pulvis-pyrius CBS 109.77 TaxID=1314802 RepID=A0A6A6WZK8_9PLEO|nr:hypothetical protein K505DRAFT_410297 [Melanomma pulvis-pyrius CBS 109.77]
MDSKHLKASKYAPRTPAESLAISRAERLKKEKEKATRLLDRLRWKAESLAASYTRALEILHAESNSNGFLDIHGETRYPFVLGMASRRSKTNMKKKQAESMFKVDFFEFYTLLERYIELCLSIFGVSVSGNAPQTNFNALRYITNPDLQKTRPEASHAFHANLLEALDSEKCPLHASFGNQDVRIQLGLAKDYRNRWKDADEKVSTNKWGSEDHDSKRNTKLEDLELNRMIMTLLVGCEHAHGVVHDRADTTSGFKSRDFEPRDYEIMDTDDTPMEYMDDAMDLD